MSTLKTVFIREDLPEPLCDYERHRFDLNLAEYNMDERTFPTTRILNLWMYETVVVYMPELSHILGMIGEHLPHR
jgi:hypothetical protein